MTEALPPRLGGRVIAGVKQVDELTRAGNFF
jgi:hypothetical protein